MFDLFNNIYIIIIIDSHNQFKINSEICNSYLTKRCETKSDLHFKISIHQGDYEKSDLNKFAESFKLIFGEEIKLSSHIWLQVYKCNTTLPPPSTDILLPKRMKINDIVSILLLCPKPALYFYDNMFNSYNITHYTLFNENKILDNRILHYCLYYSGGIIIVSYNDFDYLIGNNSISNEDKEKMKHCDMLICDNIQVIDKQINKVYLIFIIIIIV